MRSPQIHVSSGRKSRALQYTPPPPPQTTLMLDLRRGVRFVGKFDFPDEKSAEVREQTRSAAGVGEGGWRQGARYWNPCPRPRKTVGKAHDPADAEQRRDKCRLGRPAASSVIAFATVVGRVPVADRFRRLSLSAPISTSQRTITQPTNTLLVFFFFFFTSVRRGPVKRLKNRNRKVAVKLAARERVWWSRTVWRRMFQFIVQPRNTWNRSSPELRELRVAHPGDLLFARTSLGGFVFVF